LQQSLHKGDTELPDHIIFALGVLSGIFTVLIIWAYIEKRREDEAWAETRYFIDKDIISRWFFNAFWRKTRAWLRSGRELFVTQSHGSESMPPGDYAE
jgi:hypothetical protein